MRKPKQETAFDLLRKEQLRAKELTLSEEYRKDITRHQELEEELSRLRIEESAALALTHYVGIDSQEQEDDSAREERELKRAFLFAKDATSYEELKEKYNRRIWERAKKTPAYKGNTLRQEFNSSYDNILKKYSISRPVSLDLLKKIAEGLEQKGLRHRDEIPVKLITPYGTCRLIEHDGYQVDLNSKECFSIEINPRGSKTDILHYVSKLIDTCAEHGIKSDIRFRDERLRGLEVYRLRSLRYGYKKISSAIGIKPDAARKAFAKAYKLIHGTPYKGGVKLKTSKTLLKKDCNTCADRPSCKNLCPEITAYANQDAVTDNQYYGLVTRITAKSERPDIPAKGKGKANVK